MNKDSGLGATSTDATQRGAPPPPAPDDWIAYNDLMPLSSNNDVNVTEHDYTVSDSNLKDYSNGNNLNTTVTGQTVNGYDPKSNGGNFTNSSSDAYLTFDGIVDLTGVAELEAADWDHIITFNNLEPDSQYTITLTTNRDNPSYDNARFTKVTIEGAVTATNISSTGVVVNSNESVSFSTGYNTVNGYVAKWTNITTGSDGSFSIKSEWPRILIGKTKNM